MLEKIIKNTKIGIAVGALTLGVYGCSTTKNNKVNYPVQDHMNKFNQELACYESGKKSQSCENESQEMIIEYK